MNQPTLASQVSHCAGKLFSEQSAARLIEVLGEAKVRHLLLVAQSANDGGTGLAGLQKRLFCVSERVAQAVQALDITADALGIMRAARFDAEVIPALRRLIAGKHSDDDVARIRQSFSATAIATPDAGQGRPAAANEARAPVEQASAAAEPGRAPQRPPVRTAPASTAGNPQPSDRKPGRHVYGGKGAMCFQVASDQKGNVALMVDAAQATGPRQYDWQRKIIIMLTENEMNRLYLVLRGLLTTFDAVGHGEAHDKNFSIANQETKFFVKMSQAQRLVAIPMTAGDAALLCADVGQALVAAKPVYGSLAGLDAHLAPFALMELRLQKAPQQQRAA